ncbi:phosphoribosylformylglycinamidine cyclo-ligase [Alkaliphilus sp. B6464]|uniref:phosphoribosylformylglycinamidine cyclo-ligase n=1 Tax=Alkaliphilus sp. B6464 TaxID=2731219 RepID=UPI003FA49528
MMDITYKSAGVDVDEGQRAVKLMKEHVKSTFNSNVLADLGGFGGLFSLNINDYKEPVLVSGTDGVGTKLKLAFMMDKHDTIGQDCVAMCVNDILCQGGKPLFFLDYIATGKLVGEKIAQIVGGIAEGCKLAGSALIGGETAEMPGLYKEDEYDLAGFAVGIVDKADIITGKNIEAGDIILALPSSGIHSNGYSLVRKLFFDILDMKTTDYVEEFGQTLGEVLLTPTKIYVNQILSLIKDINVKGICHITGGGFYENIPRILPENVDAKIDIKSWQIPPIFKFIQQKGNISYKEMFSTFNMGVGMAIVVSQEDAQRSMEILKAIGEDVKEIGKIVKGNKQVIL